MFTGLLSDRMDVQTPTVLAGKVDDMGGEVRKPWTTRLISQPCRLTTLTVRERAAMGQVNSVGLYRLYCGPGLSITDAERIVIDSKNYEAIEAPPDFRAGSKAHHAELVVRILT